MGSNSVLLAPNSSQTHFHLVSEQAGAFYSGEPHLHHSDEEFFPHPSPVFSPTSQAPPQHLEQQQQQQQQSRSHWHGSSAADHLNLATSPGSMQEGTPPQQDASAAALLSEKKRNKLGYHRTSVACVHCRRRKIRCLVDQNDQQGRCQNCIRLKKECNFFPVDQQPPSERQRRSVPKSSSQPSSSPAPPNQMPGEGYPYGPPPIGYHPSHGGMPGNPMQIAPINTQDFGAQMYMAEGPISAPVPMSEGGTPGFWPASYSAGPESARSAQFSSPFSPGRQDGWPPQGPMHQSHQSAPVNPMGATPVGQQARSMSLQHDGQNTFGGLPMHGAGFYERGDPPSLHNSNGSPATSVSLSDATTAPGQAQTAMQYGIPPQWDPSKGFGAGAPDMGNTWYGNAVHNMPDNGSQTWQPGSHGPAGFKQG